MSAVSDYLRSLSDQEVRNPVLLNHLRRFNGFPEAQHGDITLELNRRSTRDRRDSQFQRDLLRVAEVLGLQPSVLMSAYWPVRHQFNWNELREKPAEQALDLIAQATSLDIQILVEAYWRVHVKEKKKVKPKKPPKPVKDRPKTVNYISEEDTQEMRRMWLDGEKTGAIARRFCRDAKLVSLILRNERHQERPYLELGILEPRRYDREELSMLRAARKEAN